MSHSNDMDMLPAIDQQDLAKTQEDKKPTMEDMLNLKRRDIPNKGYASRCRKYELER